TPLLNFQTTDFNYILNATALKKVSLDGVVIQSDSIPFYFISLVLIVLTFFSMILYKNLKRQLSVLRLTILLYFIALVALGFTLFLGKYFTGEEEQSVSISLGFYLFIIGFIFLLFASS